MTTSESIAQLPVIDPGRAPPHHNNLRHTSIPQTLPQHALPYHSRRSEEDHFHARSVARAGATPAKR